MYNYITLYPPLIYLSFTVSDDLILNSSNEKDLEPIDTMCTFTPRRQYTKKRVSFPSARTPIRLQLYREKKVIIFSQGDVFDNEIQISSLSYIPGAGINLYLGNLNFVFIRESTMVKEVRTRQLFVGRNEREKKCISLNDVFFISQQTGGVNNFVNNFLSDVTLIVKSHAAGIGGNAVVNFFVNECLLSTHSHKNQVRSFIVTRLQNL